MRYSHPDLRSLLFLALLIHAVAACRALAPAAAPATTQPSLRPAPPVAATELSTLHELTTTARLHAANAKPRFLPYRIRPQDSNWLVQLPGVRETVLEVRDGAQHVVSEREFSESVATAYAPPLLLLPAHLDMNKPVAGRCHVTITGLDGKPRDSGEVRYLIRLLGRQTIHTPRGPAEVYVVQSQRHMKLKLAQADIQITSRYQPGKGLVAQEVRRETRVLGLIPTQNSESLTIRR